MAENGPGGREVGRVSLRVLPDTSKFLPSLKKYAERVERTVVVRIGATVDARNIERDTALISERVERTVPTIRIPTTPVSDGFARELQAQVRAASATIEANIPLTADGEKLRRQVLVEVAELEAQIRQLDLEVPLDVESAARARAQLKARVEELQVIARMNAVEIPVKIGSSGLTGGGGFLGISPAMIASLSGVAAVLSGSVIASLPALMASIAGPVAVIALGMRGIAAAAKIAAPAFDAIRQAISNTFATELAGAFQTLAEILPAITPPMERIATALSGAFTTIINQIATPEGLASLQGILDGIATAIEILSPSLGPMVQAFLDIANTGMAAFVDAAPALNDALLTMTGVFQYLNDSGIIGLAAKAFTTFVIAAAVVAAAVGAILVTIAGAEAKINEWRQAIGTAITQVIGFFNRLGPGVVGAMQTVVALVSGLPQRVLAALSGLGDLLFGAGARLIQGLINGIASMFGPLTQTVSAIAGVIAAFFPGSPVKEGPLTSWNGGGAGIRLGDMLADGLNASHETVRTASAGLAGAVATPSLVGAAVVSGRAGADGGPVDYYRMSDVVEAGMRRVSLAVDTRENALAVARHNNKRTQL